MSITALSTEEIAELAHNVNRAYCQAIGDLSQPCWDEAPEWQKASAINGVEAHLNAPLTPEEIHVSWLAEKTSQGWVYGPIKDPENKIHPCCVPYSELSADQKVKDFLFAAVVGAFG